MLNHRIAQGFAALSICLVSAKIVSAETEGVFLASTHQCSGTMQQLPEDHNHTLRANIYASKQQYITYATEHFNAPSDNGGMYLKGQPNVETNQAEYIAYMEQNAKAINVAREKTYAHRATVIFFTRSGDYSGCQPLILSWGTSMD